MFTYWPFIGLLTSGVMVAILLVLKFGDKLCKARLTTLSDQSMAPFPDQVGNTAIQCNVPLAYKTMKK